MRAKSALLVWVVSSKVNKRRSSNDTKVPVPINTRTRMTSTIFRFIKTISTFKSKKWHDDSIDIGTGTGTPITHLFAGDLRDKESGKVFGLQLLSDVEFMDQLLVLVWDVVLLILVTPPGRPAARPLLSWHSLWNRENLIKFGLPFTL